MGSCLCHAGKAPHSHIIDRRTAVLGLIGLPVALPGGQSALAAPDLTSARAALSSARGCVISPAQMIASQALQSGFAASNDTLITSTGNTAMDKALGRALVRMSTVFGERPGFGFINDKGGPNAYASSRTQVTGTWGTVMFGQTMFTDLIDRFGETSLAPLIIAAHEFGHIAQFRSGMEARLMDGQPTVKRLELHADWLAGYFIGTRKRANPSLSVWAAGQAIYDVGDYEFNNRNHHGTPAQRVAATEAGFKVGFDGQTPFATAFLESADFIMGTF
jgi:hypothetical protein